MEKNGTLIVKMLGGFSMIYNGVELIDSRQTVSQFGYLMESLLFYREKGVDRSLLQETLFEDREIDDVQHAIRNVIYNAKRRLKAYGLPDVNFVEIRQGRYYWTDKIPVELDTERLQYLHDKADAEEDQQAKLELLLEACHLYKGDFLSRLNTAIWVALEARGFRRLFQNCANQAAELLRRKKAYKELKELGEFAATVDPFADWEVLTVEALAALGRYEEAQKFCEDTVDLYIEEHGQRSSAYVRELSNRLSARLIHQHESLDEIQDKLIETYDSDKGGFSCSYPAFQEVYRILSRTLDRYKDRLFVMLCTVVDSKGNPMKESPKLDELSDRLSEAIVKSIRHSDTVTKYGKGQYLVLLVNTTLENCEIVERRVTRNFLIGRQRIGIEYSVKSVIISSADL